MGLIKAAGDAIGSMFADQWREYFYCDSISEEILVVKGQKRVTEGRNSNTKGIDNIISNGSIIAVNEGQCMIIVDQGGIVEFCAEAGEFVFDSSTEPSLLYGSLGESVKKTFLAIGKRFTFGGNAAKDQRVYFFNIKEIMDNKFGTANPIPFRIEVKDIGLNFDTSLRCNGTYSFKLIDPLLFYKNVCGNVTEAYTRDKMASQMKAEIVTALQPSLAKLSAKGVRYSDIPAYAEEITQYLNEEMSEKWIQLRGIQLVSMNMSAPTIPQSDLEKMNKLQFSAVYRDPGMGAAAMVEAQTQSMLMGAEAMKAAASNTATGPMLAFAGMKMASMASNANMANFGGGMGMNANQLYQMDAQNRAAQQQSMNAGTMGGMMGATGAQGQGTPVLGWSCSCGKADNRGKFCENCGSPKPAAAGWTCGCGAVNQGKFCAECGSKKPEGAPLYKCDKCGWEPEDPTHPPKFCPECGDVFDDKDKQ